MLLAMLDWPPPTVAALRPRTQACTHTSRLRRRRRRQTCVAATLREGPTRRRQRTHALSARDDIRPGKKTNSNTLRRDEGTHELLAMLLMPPLTVAQLRPRKNRHARTQADANANADVKHA